MDCKISEPSKNQSTTLTIANKVGVKLEYITKEKS